MPVITTQRISIPRSRSGIASASAFRISWSRALRRLGFEIVSRATASTGWSRTSFPPASGSALTSIEDDQDVALLDGLALLAPDLRHRAWVLGLARHLHLHRLEDDDRVALVHLVADGDLDLPHGSRDVGWDVHWPGAAE